MKKIIKVYEEKITNQGEQITCQEAKASFIEKLSNDHLKKINVMLEMISMSTCYRYHSQLLHGK